MLLLTMTTTGPPTTMTMTGPPTTMVQKPPHSLRLSVRFHHVSRPAVMAAVAVLAKPVMLAHHQCSRSYSACLFFGQNRLVTGLSGMQ
jgi:hypothetical protein